MDHQRVTAHYTHGPTKTIPPRCMCCWADDHHTISRENVRKDIPKLIPSYMAATVQRTSSPEMDDSVRVSVIKKPDFPEVPMRKLSVSSTDRQSSDGYYSDKHYDDFADNRRSVSPSYHPYKRREIFKTLPADIREVAVVKRKKLTVLQRDNDFTMSNRCESYINYREIPSPGYPTSPRYYVNENASPEPPQFVFAPYLESSLRNKHYAEMSSFPDLSRGIKKRHRTIFTPSQLRKLEEKFNECNFIVGEDRQLLAKQLKLKEHQVKIWFQNRRTKVKQSAKDTTSSEIDVVS